MYPSEDDIMRYFPYLLFDRPQFLTLNCSLYMEGEIWSVLEKFRYQRQELLQVFEGLSDSV